MEKRLRHDGLHLPSSVSGSPDHRTKVDLATAINKAISERQLSQAEASSALGMPQPKISAIANFRLDGFSVQRLFRILNALGRDVVIQVGEKKESGSTGRTYVSAA